MYLLDTNIVSARLKVPRLRKRGVAVPENLQRAHDRVVDLSLINVSVLTYWEIERGLKNKNEKANLVAFYSYFAEANVIPLDDRVFSIASDVWVAGARRGRRPPEVDALIVATAKAWGYTIVSDDGDVATCAGLQEPPVSVENWLAALV